MISRVTYIVLTVLMSGCLCFIAGRMAHLSFPVITVFTVGLAGYLLLRNPASADPAPTSLTENLELIRAKYHLPALAGAVFTTDGLVEMAATGLRKSDADVPVTTEDLWHLGSDTKMMTALLAGTFVAEQKLAWDDKIVSFFPNIAAPIPDSMRNVTLGQLLAHQAGLKENLDWWSFCKNGSLTNQRQAAAEMALSSPVYPPGSFHYANTDYVVAGAILEKIGGKPWEDLICEKVFQPLGLVSAGFGGVGSLGQVDQPWPHLATGPAPTNGPTTDNPPIMAPAGTVHGTMKDWSRFLTDQLRGAAGLKALLPAEIYQAMQTPAPGSDYGYGWIVTKRSWAGGKALTHAGSNTLNYAVCWLAPAKKFGVLVCANQGGKRAAQAVNKAAWALILNYLAQQKGAGKP